MRSATGEIAGRVWALLEKCVCVCVCGEVAWCFQKATPGAAIPNLAPDGRHCLKIIAGSCPVLGEACCYSALAVSSCLLLRLGASESVKPCHPPPPAWSLLFHLLHSRLLLVLLCQPQQLPLSFSLHAQLISQSNFPKKELHLPPCSYCEKQQLSKKPKKAQETDHISEKVAFFCPP